MKREFNFKYKKILSCLLAMIMLMSSLPVFDISAFAAKIPTLSELGTDTMPKGYVASKKSNMYWKLDRNTETLTVYGLGALYGNLIVDNGPNANNAVSISGCEYYKHLVIENGISAINVSFLKGDNLETIETPLSLNEIPSKAFQNCTKLQSVKLGELTRSIGSYAFAGCDSLQSVNIPDSVYYINSYAFNGCTSLKNVVCGSGLKTVDDKAFYDSGLRLIGLQENVSYIGASTFTNCDKDLTFAVPKGCYAYYYATAMGYNVIQSGQVKDIDAKGKFDTGDCTWNYDCDSKTLTVSGNGDMGTTYILDSDEEDLSYWYPQIRGLKNVFIEDGVTSIPNEVFSNMLSIESVSIAKSVTNIGQGCFSNCTSLETVDLNLLSADIKYNTFKDCEKLNKVLNADNVLSVGSNAFDGCKSLEEFDVQNPNSVGDYAFKGCEKLCAFNFGSSLSYLGTYAFNGCKSLKSALIQGTLSSISDYAFYGCTSLEGVSIGDGVEKIGTYAFANCISLKLIDFSNTLGVICDFAFNGCTSLTEIIIPHSVFEVKESAFAGCSGAKTLDLGLLNASDGGIDLNSFAGLVSLSKIIVNYNSTEDDCNYSQTFGSIALNSGSVEYVLGDDMDSYSGQSIVDLVASKEKRTVTTSITVGENIKSFSYEPISISDIVSINVDKDNPYIKSDTVAVYTTDGEKILACANGIDSSYQIEEGTQVISDYAFRYCKAEYISIPSTVTEIGYKAFSYSNIKSVVIPSSVKVFGERIFQGCDNLKKVNIKKGVTEIPNYMFSNCDTLKTVEIPSSVTVIGSYAFNQCKALSSVIMSNGVKTIKAYAFYRCASLTGIVIPKSVELIETHAFRNCDALEDVYVAGYETVFQKGTRNYSPFYDCNYYNEQTEKCLTFYCMAGSTAQVYAYKYGFDVSTYSDRDTFNDLLAMKTDIYAGYTGFCDDGHGDIEWLTVTSSSCEHQGYQIGVCEYCSEILEERRTEPCGHNYAKTVIEPTNYSDGAEIYTCQNCGDSYSVTLPSSGIASEKLYSVFGYVGVAEGVNKTNSRYCIEGVTVSVDGVPALKTDERGSFTLRLKSGVHALTFHYTYGFDRTVCVNVKNQSVDTHIIPIIACDFTRNGQIDESDVYLARMIYGTFNWCNDENENEGYLDYVDLDDNGQIGNFEISVVESYRGVSATQNPYSMLVF